jgi:hypothetical protein
LTVPLAGSLHSTGLQSTGPIGGTQLAVIVVVGSTHEMLLRTLQSTVFLMLTLMVPSMLQSTGAVGWQFRLVGMLQDTELQETGPVG